MEREPVPVGTVVAVVRDHGSQADIANGRLVVVPRGRGPRIFEVMDGAINPRRTIEIGKRCGIPSECFWHPEMTREDALRNSGVANIEDAKKKRDSKKPTGSDGSE